MTSTAVHSTGSPGGVGQASAEVPARNTRRQHERPPTNTRYLTLWLPPLALMAVIFFLSDQPNLHSNLGIVDLIGRKLIHFGEYALLCWLLQRAFLGTFTMGTRSAVLAALLVSSAYAASDEFHQSFVPGRSATVRDWAIDTAGALLASYLRLREVGSRNGRSG